MIFLQSNIGPKPISSVAMNNSSSHEVFFYLEIAILILVFIIQMVHSYKLYYRIQDLKAIFKDRLTIINGYLEKSKIGHIKNIQTEIQYDSKNSESFNEVVGDDIIKLPLVQTQGKNESITRIKNTLNSYLVNNYGAAVNFSIIKDIIDREVDVKDEEISQFIPTPLYLGLGATMIGIIFGLLSMPQLSPIVTSIGNSDPYSYLSNNNREFTDAINALIRGVKYAMIASLSGLACTTILSSYIYKGAKRIVLNDKNDQLSYLQAELLPELVRAEDTGVSGLKASLDRFARVATKISDNVIIAAEKIDKTLQAQLKVISKVENMNMIKVSKVNLELFDRLESNMDAFYKFSEYLSSMNSISENLLAFSHKTDNIESIASEIKLTLQKSQEIMYFLQQHTKSLTAHIEQIEASGGAARDAVNLADSHFREAIDKLKEEVNSRISTLNNLSDITETTLKETFNEIGIKLSEITEQHIAAFLHVYSESIPQFKQLDHLEILPLFREELSLKVADFHSNSVTRSDKLIESTNELNNSLKSLQNNLGNHSILSKLGIIEETLKKNNHRPSSLQNSKTKVNVTEIQSEVPKIIEERVSLREVFTNLFKL